MLVVRIVEFVIDLLKSGLALQLGWTELFHALVSCLCVTILGQLLLL